MPFLWQIRKFLYIAKGGTKKKEQITNKKKDYFPFPLFFNNCPMIDVSSKNIYNLKIILNYEIKESKFMKKTKPYAAMPVLSRVAFFLLTSLSLLLFFACEDEPTTQEEDMSISEITVYNVPVNIPVKDKDTVNEAFKIYLNASNSQDPTVPPVAKGVARLSAGTKNDGKYSIKIKLQKPNTADDKNPNTDTGSWSGTANYFSIMISPQSVASDGINAIWMRAGMTLNKGKKECNWETLIDSRTNPLVKPEQIQALYNDIILNDGDLQSQ